MSEVYHEVYTHARESGEPVSVARRGARWDVHVNDMIVRFTAVIDSTVCTLPAPLHSTHRTAHYSTVVSTDSAALYSCTGRTRRIPTVVELIDAVCSKSVHSESGALLSLAAPPERCGLN